ncbi:urea transporter, partial [Staphylococcus hominis]|uniref:urea transporter n=1 Tax=Staphylococcus hominis TaxID=1290 RepID=UPI0021B675E6
MFTQIFLLTSIIPTLLIIIPIFIPSLKGGIYPIVSTILPLLSITLLPTHYPTITHPFYPYNSILTAIPFPPTFKTKFNPILPLI